MAVWGQNNKRRRRRRSAPPAAASASVHRAPQIQLRSAELLASLSIAIAAVTLTSLVWLIAGRAIDGERAQLHARIETTISGQSLVLADMVRREMLGVDQSLRILRRAFQVDPVHFDIWAWREAVPALTDVIDDVFIADEQLIIRHALYQPDVGSALDAHAARPFGLVPDRLGREEALFIGPAVDNVQTRQQVMLLMLPLELPTGWAVGAMYRTAALTRLFAEAQLGIEGMTAMIDTRRGWVQTVAGLAAIDRKSDISASSMYAAMNARPDGTWIGPSAPDGVRRIHAFRRVPGRQLATVVAVSEAEAMQPAVAWAEDVRSVATAATLVILAAASLALYAVWTYRVGSRLRQTIEQDELEMMAVLTELTVARQRLESRGGQLEALFAMMGDGALLLDADLRVKEWNPHAAELLGLTLDMLQTGMPLDEMLRFQAREGAFGSADDIEVEVARRLATLQTPTGTAPVLYGAPHGQTLAVAVTRHADGSLLLVMREASAGDLQSAVGTTPVIGSVERL